MTPPVSILAGVKKWFLDNASAAGLASGAPLQVDFLGPDLAGYSIVTMPGAEVEWYLNGGSTRTFPFALQANFSTADDAERIDNIGFYETLSDWLHAQSEADTLPGLCIFVSRRIQRHRHLSDSL